MKDVIETLAILLITAFGIGLATCLVLGPLALCVIALIKLL